LRGARINHKLWKRLKKEKKASAVKMMNEIRDKISLETKGMTLSELKLFIENRIKESKFKPVGQ